MSNKLVRWVARSLVAGCLIAGAVVLGMGSSSATTSQTTVPAVVPAPPITPTDNNVSWIGG